MADEPQGDTDSSGPRPGGESSFFGAHGAAGANVRVVCRVRPQNSREKEAGGKPCVQIDDDGRGLKLKGGYFDDFGACRSLTRLSS